MQANQTTNTNNGDRRRERQERRERNKSQTPNAEASKEKREKRERGKTSDGRVKKQNFAKFFTEQMGLQTEQIDKVFADWKTYKAEFKAQKNVENQKPWKAKMAKLIQAPEDVINAQAGKMVLVPIEVHNNSMQLWKEGINLTLDDSVDQKNIPCEVISVPVDIEQMNVEATGHKLRNHETLKMNVPIKINANADACTYEMLLTFRNKKNKAFGEKIPIKIAVKH